MKAYLIIDINITDMQGFMEYVARIPALLEKHAGTYLVQGVVPTLVEGEDPPPQRSVIIEFPRRQEAQAFLAERAGSDLHDIWTHTTSSRILLVDSAQ